MLRGASSRKLLNYLAAARANLYDELLAASSIRRAPGVPLAQVASSALWKLTTSSRQRHSHQNHKSYQRSSKNHDKSSKSSIELDQEINHDDILARLRAFAAAIGIAVTSVDTDASSLASSADSGSTAVAVTLDKHAAPSRLQRTLLIAFSIAKICTALVFYCCILPVMLIIDRVFNTDHLNTVRAMFQQVSNAVGAFLGVDPSGRFRGGDYFDERYAVEFVHRGAETLLESLIAGYAIQLLYKHPFVAEKFGTLTFDTKRGDSFARAILADTDLVPMTPRTYEFTLHGSKAEQPLKIIAQVALGPSHGPLAASSKESKDSLGVHTAYLAIEDPRTGERIVVVDPKNFHAQSLSTSVLRLVPDSARLRLIEGSSLTSVEISGHNLQKKTLSKVQEFSFKICGSRGCAEIRSDTSLPQHETFPYNVSGNTTIDINTGNGPSKFTFSEKQISAANTVSFIELLTAVRSRLGGPLCVDPNTIKDSLDIEIDKVINTVEMTLKGPNGAEAPVQVVFLVDPLKPSQRILWRVNWTDSGDVVYENTATSLSSLNQ